MQPDPVPANGTTLLQTSSHEELVRNAALNAEHRVLEDEMAALNERAEKFLRARKK